MTTLACATVECNDSATGKSKYCTPHKRAAREAFKAMIADKGNDKADREAAHLALFQAAHVAGSNAGEKIIPEPMYVGTPTHPLGNDIDPSKPIYTVNAGVCGFAWINVNPGNSSFARWLTTTKRARKAYQGGVSISVSGYGQSMTRKEAYAGAFTKVLRDAGIKAYAESRMD